MGQGDAVSAREMPQLKIVPIISCFKGLTSLFLSVTVQVTVHPPRLNMVLVSAKRIS